ncbi:hypothetical protein TWF173_002974 [Orbilia oligospora]|uniref:Uncharacterized protein n=2 Tax=Orbilia oligospora TaxID=2813651 RepID=G1XV42_ARTOA|nr:hypothetical protein AOL_s00215g850 [Orbilia oligospora ATCC 24927]EGX43064.1 hypothetical protein AOL_s00215g850 [Orbilia oligospora ATCC 24927]KAF3283714.1 hypothetical protein TWF970_000890 [Orbilia oligospora]KAF3307467.1 hypothetical protein TWF173_002974 [Orbilia oligospora]
MLSAKVAMVEDFNSEVQEVIPSSRIQAFKKRQSGLASVTNYSDAGTVDSGYSSTSAPNGQEEHELFPESDSPSRHTPQSDLSDSNISERTPVNRPIGLESEGRARSSNAHRASGKYAFVPGLSRNIERIERPLSRSTSKRDSTGRASPAIRPQDADECDCPHCAKASSSAQPSPSMAPPDAGLDGSWSLDMSNSLPSYNPNSLDYSSGLLSGSPGRTRGAARESNGFFETFPTANSNASGNGRPSSLLSNTNPLGGLSTSYEYTASPSTYTPQSAVNPLLSPPPYLGVDEWVPPTTPTSLRNRDHTEDYANYSSNDYLYGNGSGALSASGGNHNNYDLPPRSASVQPAGLRNRPRSSTYHVDYPVGAMGPPQRRASKAPAPKRIHSATNSYDAGRYDTATPYPSYDSYDNTAEDFHSPAHHPISRRLSRAGSGALPPLDITRATSVPPVDNYVAGIERARRMTITPQPMQIANRDRNRRGSNASSGLSSSASRRAHEARMSMAEMIDSVKVEPRPELAGALTKRDSTGGAIVKHGYSPAEFDYATDGAYNTYDYPYDNSGMEIHPYHHEEFEQELVLSGPSEPFSSRYGIPPKLHYAGADPLHRSLRMNSDRRRSMHRRLSDYQHGVDYSHANDLDELRQLTKSRNSGLDRRLPPNPAYIEDGHVHGY